MSYYRVCPHCGAHLDPGESCACTLTQVCTEARAAFPERFTGRTDREIASEIAGVVSRYGQLTQENQESLQFQQILINQNNQQNQTNQMKNININ